MVSILIVALGSALGGVARYVIAGWIQAYGGTSFPWGTLAVNTTGSLALGVLFGWLAGVPASAQWRLFLAMGFCGAYTTFSTFSFETSQLMRDREWPAAGGYMLASVVGGVGGLLLGFAAAGWLLRGRG